MKKTSAVLTLFTIALINHSVAQGYNLKFNRVIDTVITYSVPCSVNLINGTYYDILTVNSGSAIVNKIEAIYVEWPGYINTGSSSCGSGGAGQFRVQPAIKKNGIYTELTGDNNTGNYGAAETKFKGVFWATKGTTVAVKASMGSSSSYPYLASAYSGKVRISMIEFNIVP